MTESSAQPLWARVSSCRMAVRKPCGLKKPVIQQTFGRPSNSQPLSWALRSSRSVYQNPRVADSQDIYSPSHLVSTTLIHHFIRQIIYVYTALSPANTDWLTDWLCIDEDNSVKSETGIDRKQVIFFSIKTPFVTQCFALQYIILNKRYSVLSISVYFTTATTLIRTSSEHFYVLWLIIAITYCPFLVQELWGSLRCVWGQKVCWRFLIHTYVGN